MSIRFCMGSRSINGGKYNLEINGSCGVVWSHNFNQYLMFWAWKMHGGILGQLGRFGNYVKRGNIGKRVGLGSSKEVWKLQNDRIHTVSSKINLYVQMTL